MSFKRDGDDKSLLGLLRKRRVQELFAEKIPDDEAQMLSNGKFACTVCHYKPVFDTVQVLAQHRSGKKHLENAKRANVKKQEIKELIEIRLQEQLLQNGGSTALPGVSPTSVTSTSLQLTNSPYDARALKNKIKLHERRPIINLSTSSVNAEPFLGAAKTPFSLLKSSSSSAEKPESLKPYARKNATKDKPKSSANTKQLRREVFMADNLPSNVKHKNSEFEPFKMKAEWENFTASLDKKKCANLKSTSNTPSDGRSSATFPAEDTKLNVMDPQKKELMQKHWQVAGSGWRKDWTGKWEKDEEAEFDSDEEPPDFD